MVWWLGRGVDECLWHKRYKQEMRRSQHINLHAGLPGIFKYLTAQSIPADVSEGLRPNSKQEATAEMIESGPGIAESLAAAARASLDEQVKKLRAQGRLDAGKSTLEKLEWTTETAQAGQEFKKNVDLALLKTFGVTNRTSEDIKWTGPIVYSDAMSPPLKYATAAEGYGILGILALGTLQLPEIGDSGSREIKSGHVAYFRASDSVVYRSCGGGQGILFYISV